ncbi:MAG: hypothetical protein FE78DRAFT_538309 [Acidomyces sp. 'richmondensis']|nr:MAG: hypothetical protein FE78DRAFT_538309 [Acidomyces sp. 'richmondensis']
MISVELIKRSIRGQPSREAYRPATMSLAKKMEKILLQEVLYLDSLGLSPSLAIIKDKTSAICKARGVKAVGIDWVPAFVKRRCK